MLFSSLLLILSIPVGLYIAWLAYDELVPGRNYIALVGIASLVLAITMQRYELFAGMFTGFFMTIVAGIGVIQSYNKSVTRRTKTHKKPGNNERE